MMQRCAAQKRCIYQPGSLPTSRQSASGSARAQVVEVGLKANDKAVISDPVRTSLVTKWQPRRLALSFTCALVRTQSLCLREAQAFCKSR